MDSFGLRIVLLNQENRNRFGIDGQMKGVVILDVNVNSPGVEELSLKVILKSIHRL